MTAAAPFDRARWAAVSAQLDALLELGADGRVERLARLRATDPAIADELTDLLARIEAQENAAFMRLPAMPLPVAAVGLAGQAVGPYALERLLGEGGMGSVWLARRSDGRYDAQVAIKFLRGGLFGGGSVQRFEREGRILARLDHPHIGRLLDAGLTGQGDQPYLVLEYVDGEPIDRYCTARALDLAARLRLVTNVLDAVAHAQARLILHRDLKPSNVLVTKEGQVKLLDFGIAKLVTDALDGETASDLTQLGASPYTPRYAAPEQVQGAEVTPATDVYALGVLLYVLLTGAHPTSARSSGTATSPNSLEHLRAVVEVQPRPMSEVVRRQTGQGAGAGAGSKGSARRRAQALRGDLDTLVAKALKKRPADRYRGAADMADDLRRHLGHEPIAARPESVGYRVGRLLRRHWLIATATGTTALALTVGLTVALVQAREAAAQRAHAESLIEFMLGDLREKLEPVGRLDVLDAVGERALAYYGTDGGAGLDANGLGRRARALQLIGSLAEQRLRLDEAEAVLRRAAAITAQLVERYPRDAKRLSAHAASHSGLALVATRRNHPQDAEPEYRLALSLAERAEQLAPDDFDLRVAAVDARSDLGSFLVDIDRSIEALPLLNAALADYRGFVRRKPVLRRTMVNIGSIVADANHGLGRYTDAIAAVDGHWDALRQAPGGEQDRELQLLRSLGLNRRASSELNLGRVDAAVRVSEEVVARTAALVALEPENLQWLDWLGYQRLLLSEILLAAHRPAQAQAQLPHVERALERLLRANPAAHSLRFKMKGRLLAQAVRLAPNDPEVLASLQAFLSEVDRAESAPKVLDVDGDVAKAAAAASLHFGEALAAQGRLEEARSVWIRALQRLAPYESTLTPYSKFLLMRLHWRLHHLAEARRWMAELEATEYRPPDYLETRSGLEAERAASGAAPRR